jgi:hypothetical protein
MFETLWRRRTTKSAKPSSRRRARQAELCLENLEDRCVPTGTLTGAPFTSLFPQPVEGSSFTGQLATVFDDGPVAPRFTVSINWGDGTAQDTTTGMLLPIPGSPSAFAVMGTHTYAEESSSVTPPFTTPVTLSISDTANGLGAITVNSQTSVLDANLSQGDPVTEAPSQTFLGGGTNQPSASSALKNFEAAIGGVNNKATPAPQASGFRTINWDGVKTDGTDAAAGPNSTVVIGSKTVGIPLDRFQTNGVYFGAVYAVSGDGFTQVNPSVGAATNPPNGLFTPFSAPNTFAMFNDNGIDFKFVVPSPDNSTVVSAATRGFGAIFINVELPNTTTIQYFNGNNLVDTESAPVGGKGNAVFVGALFKDQIITRVVLTLGTDVLFSFDGTTTKPGLAADDGVNHNLVVTDDWAFPEPAATANGLPIVTGAQGTTNAAVTNTAVIGVPFTGVVATFNDQDPAANAKDFTATINWGDGHLTNGTITADGHGGFSVSGTNTYKALGQFPINVDIADFGGGNGINGSAPVVSVNNTILVTAGGQNQRFVAQAYLDLLGRTVDPSGLQFFGGLLDNGIANRLQVVEGIENSLEYRTVEVNQAYQQILGRQADPIGLNTFTQFLTNGGTVEQLKAMLASSQEFQADAQAQDTTAGLTTANQKVVDFLFQKVLGRTADATGLATFSNVLAGDGGSMAVAQAIISSPEAEANLVKGFYLQFLKRAADSGGLNAFTQALVGGTRDEVVIAQFVASDEYFGRV